MTKQPEALRLADWLEYQVPMTPPLRTEAAAELRRLHAANQELLEVLKIARGLLLLPRIGITDARIDVAIAKHGGAA